MLRELRGIRRSLLCELPAPVASRCRGGSQLRQLQRGGSSQRREAAAGPGRRMCRVLRGVLS